jgi:hypothetical protein
VPLHPELLRLCRRKKKNRVIKHVRKCISDLESEMNALDILLSL